MLLEHIEINGCYLKKPFENPIVKSFKFNGFKDLLKIQKDKSYDLAIVFVQDCKMNNLPKMSNIIANRIIFFFGGRGSEDVIVEAYKSYFNEELCWSNEK